MSFYTNKLDDVEVRAREAIALSLESAKYDLICSAYFSKLGAINSSHTVVP